MTENPQRDGSGRGRAAAGNTAVGKPVPGSAPPGSAPPGVGHAEPHDGGRRERLVRTLAAATFLVFFQAYMVAPLIPRLAAALRAPLETAGLVVPAYLIPYGVATLVYGPLADRIGRRRVMLASLAAFVVLVPLTATSRSATELVGWRVATGVGASGLVPLALALIGALYPYQERGRPLGWLFGAMAGGMATGSTLGAVLEPALGWRGVFLVVGALSLPVAALLVRDRHLLDVGHAAGAGRAARAGAPGRGASGTVRDLAAAYRALLAAGRGLRTYAFVFVNAVFHSGVFTWLGLYFARRYGLGEVGIGLALLGYGVPGFLLGPVIGRAADRWGRRWLVPAGLAVSAAAALLLAAPLPLVAAALAVTVLSLGYDMTQPLLAGIVTALGGPRGGQAMGLNVFLLFTGFGIGSLAFGATIALGFAPALLLFGALQLTAAAIAAPLFRDERAGPGPANRKPGG